MEEKKNKKVGILAVLLILAVIAMIVMSIFMFKLNNDKQAEIQKSTELQGKVDDLNTTVSELQGKIDSISETINNNTSNETINNQSSSSNGNSKEDEEGIILNGTYGVPNSDVGFTFSKNGKTTIDSNLATSIGTYKTTEKNTVEAHYTQKTVLNEETDERTVTDIDEYEKFIVDDNKDVFWINSDGNKVQLIVIGEVDKAN